MNIKSALIFFQLHEGYADWFETSGLHNDSVALTKMNADLLVTVMDYTAQASFKSVLIGYSTICTQEVQYTRQNYCLMSSVTLEKAFQSLK